MELPLVYAQQTFICLPNYISSRILLRCLSDYDQKFSSGGKERNITPSVGSS